MRDVAQSWARIWGKPVRSIEYVNKTVALEAGRSYRLVASGLWIDWFILCGPDGFSNPVLDALYGPFKRVPSSRFFALMGVNRANTGGMEEVFEIGRGTYFRPQFDGTLYVFANDNPWAYSNNLGSVNLVIDISEP